MNVINDGILNLINQDSLYYNTITLQDIENALLDICSNIEPEPLFTMHLGGTYWYGEKCNNLQELRKERDSAIANRNNIHEWFRVKQKLVRKHGKIKQIRKHLRPRRKFGKKSRRYYR